MRIAAFYALVLLWVLWAVPFLIRRTRATGTRRAKTARISILGMALQTASYPLVWSTDYFWTHELEVWRVLSAAALGALALLLIWSALPALGNEWRLQAGVYEDHRLIQSGAYGVVRHPIYASMIALLLATGFLLAPLTVCAMALALMIAGTEIRIHAEERLLAERFGQQFFDYRARVPAYLPFLR
jgi:protein-S-isoprenylcysteine O-methyltransferase Ste14